MKNILLCLSITVAFAYNCFGQITIDITGGISTISPPPPVFTELDVDVSIGGTIDLSSSLDPGTEIFLVFKSVFSGNVVGGAGGSPNADLDDEISGTLTLGPGSFSKSSLGTMDIGDVVTNDLVIGWTYTGSGNSSTALTLGTGSIGTQTGSSINYNSINSGGQVCIVDALGNIISAHDLENPMPGDPTWSIIPEPSTYALIIGTACLGLVIWKRKRQGAHSED